MSLTVFVQIWKDDAASLLGPPAQASFGSACVCELRDFRLRRATACGHGGSGWGHLELPFLTFSTNAARCLE